MKSTISVKFGNRCNFSCRHCCQGEYGQQVEERMPVNEGVFDYIDREAREWAALSPEHKPFGQAVTRVRLWGGEPLLYLEQIEEFVHRLKDSPVRFSLPTNGALLDEKVVRFVNEHGIHVALSNDGPQTGKIRLVNVLEDERVVHFFRQIKNRSVTMVLHAYSQDVFAAWDYILAKAGEETPIFTELLMAVAELPSDICAFDLPAFEITMARLVREFDPAKQTPVYNFLAGQLANVLVYALGKADRQAPYCRQGFQAVCLDTGGKFYPCHNFGEALGSIELPEDELAARYKQLVRPVYRYEECLVCEVFELCRGHCPFVRPSENKSMCCEVRKVFFAALAGYLHVEGLKYKEGGV